MNCARCGARLERWQIAQPMPVLDEVVRPASVCDGCARTGAWLPGTPESLERLLRGQVDPGEQARLAGEVPSVAEPVADVLGRAARAGGFEIPESMR